MSERPLHVCYFGTYRANYSRNRNMIHSLRLAGIEVSECHARLWHGVEDRVGVASGGWRQPQFWFRVLGAYLQLLRLHRQAGNYDILMVGYPGQLDVFLARLLSWLRGKPLVWDLFMSIYLIALERGLEEKSPFAVGYLRRLEGWAIRLPNLLIQDTEEYVGWLHSIYEVPEELFRLVPTGADNSIFKPIDQSPPVGERFQAVYYGSFIPNHGVDKIVEAARYLEDSDAIDLIMIGEGPEKAQAEEFASRHGLNIRFEGWMGLGELVDYLATADLLLGAFGDTPQSLMTIQNKIYEGLAMRKPVLSGDSPTAKRQFTHRKHIYLCDRDPIEIARGLKILRWDEELRQEIAAAGHELFKEKFSLEMNGQRLAGILKEVQNKR